MRSAHNSRVAAPGARIVALGVACLFMRALVPAGYMPGNLLAGEYMVLCPVGVPAELAALLHGGHGNHGGDVVDADRTCPIGSALKPAFLPVDTTQPAVLWLAELPVPVQPVLIPPTRHLSAYRSRAPPRA